jgi:hypothetical protein
MKYFKVTMDSENYMGHEFFNVFAAENEAELVKSEEFIFMLENMEEDIEGAGDEDDDEDCVSVIIDEISFAEFLDYLEIDLCG